MDLSLFRESLSKLLQEKLAPIALEADLKGEFPLEVYQTIAKSGFAAAFLPEEYGGANSFEGLMIALEEMSKISPGFALSTMVTFQLFGYNVSKLGNEDQKKRFLKPLVEEGKVGCWALTEPDRGSDAVQIQTTATRDGNDYILKGSKTFITNAPIADFFLIIAKTGGEGFRSASTFLVEKGAPGLSVSQPFKKCGHRSSPTGQVFLDNVRVPAANRMGEEGQAFPDMKHSLEIERFLVGPLVAGMLQGMIEKCVPYAYSRVQFGQPILFYQLIQEKIAKMRMHLEMIQAAVSQGISLFNAGKPITNLATALKLYAAKAATDMGSEAMQLHGGNGYMHEYGVEMFWRDAKLLEIGGGTNEMMVQILAKNTIKEIGKKFGVI